MAHCTLKIRFLREKRTPKINKWVANFKKKINSSQKPLGAQSEQIAVNCKQMVEIVKCKQTAVKC